MKRKRRAAAPLRRGPAVLLGDGCLLLLVLAGTAFSFLTAFSVQIHALPLLLGCAAAALAFLGLWSLPRRWWALPLALLAAARRRGSQRLYHVMQTLGATGIRVSELVFVTVEALAAGRALVHCKGKRRAVLLPQKLCRALQGYCRARGITAGPVFVTRTGRPVDRSNLWREMQALCSRAGVEARKVFPHNFRHLFARAFYALDKDLAKLADLLGHASIETTRIYIMESGAEHKRQVERLGLIL